MTADDHGYANMIVGDGSEMVECEIDPCDIVIEVDEEDKCKSSMTMKLLYVFNWTPTTLAGDMAILVFYPQF